MSSNPDGRPDQAELEQYLRDLKHDFRSHLWIVSFCFEQLQKNYGEKLDAETLSFIDGAVEAAQEMRKLLEGLSRFEESPPT